MELSALILDVEGTLAETEDVHLAAYNEAFLDFGLNWTWTRSMYSRLIRVSDGPERIFAHAAKHHPDFVTALEHGDLFQKLFDKKTAYFSRFLAEGSGPLRPGVARLIDEANTEGIPMALVTLSSRENTELLVKKPSRQRCAGLVFRDCHRR